MPSSVLKTSRTLARRACAMTRDGTPFLNEEYCFADDTFKQYPGYVTLSAFIYVKILRKMLKLCIMEIESESSEN